MLPSGKYLKIFVDSRESPEIFAKSLEIILGLPLQPSATNDDMLYTYSDQQHRWFNFGYHPFETDGDLRFEEYRYCIEIGIFNIYHWEERQQMLIDFARILYNKLKDAQAYGLLFVDNLQIKLDEFAPAAQGKILKDVG